MRFSKPCNLVLILAIDSFSFPATDFLLPRLPADVQVGFVPSKVAEFDYSSISIVRHNVQLLHLAYDSIK